MLCGAVLLMILIHSITFASHGSVRKDTSAHNLLGALMHQTITKHDVPPNASSLFASKHDIE